MSSETASILHREGDKDMRSSIDRCVGHREDAVCLKLAVFGLFGRMTRDSRGIFEDDVAVDSSHHPIHHQVAAFRKVIKYYNVPGSRRVRGLETPSLCNHRHVWYPYVLKDRDEHSRQAAMYVSCGAFPH